MDRQTKIANIQSQLRSATGDDRTELQDLLETLLEDDSTEAYFWYDDRSPQSVIDQKPSWRACTFKKNQRGGLTPVVTPGYLSELLLKHSVEQHEANLGNTVTWVEGPPKNLPTRYEMKQSRAERYDKPPRGDNGIKYVRKSRATGRPIGRPFGSKNKPKAK